MPDTAAPIVPFTILADNEHTQWILGQPCFACANMARLFRDSGQKIPLKAEAEQAAVIRFYLNFYIQYGATWRDECGKEVNRLVEIVKNKFANEDGT